LVAIESIGSHTAILYFSHRPEREWQNKWFVRQDYTKTRQVAEALYQHSRQAVEASGLPVLEVNEAEQRGQDFGTRLANAIADAFAQGYERVIAVGSDCPRLHEIDWAEVERHLERGAPVLGPTPDGEGAYLIALRREQFDRERFEALPWTTPTLLRALWAHLEQRTETAPTLLAPRDDVNGHGDLVSMLRAGDRLPEPLRSRLRIVLGAVHSAAQTVVRAGRRPVIERRARAPPASPFRVRPMTAPQAA
jgi:Uncharacterized protein conserved in bacteria